MNQHQDYDKIFRENFSKVANSLLVKLCGISPENIENVDTTLPRTLERRADFLKMGIDPLIGTKALFHMEFQSKVHQTMDRRELLYYGLFYDKFGLPIHQYVVYLGNGNWTAPTTVQHANLTFSYNVICINTIDYEVFTSSDDPEEIILAILANFKKKENAKVVQEILRCLKSKVKNQRKLQKLIFQLEILSNLRNLQPEITKQLSTMSIDYDITKDLRFIQGEELGIDKGIDKGKTEVILKGYPNGITITMLSNITSFSEAQVIQILKDNNLM